jgi:hypothetical protein
MKVNENMMVYDYLRKYFDEEIALEVYRTAEESIESILMDMQKHTYPHQMFKLRDDFYRLRRIFLNLGLWELALEAEKLQGYVESGNFTKLIEFNELFIDEVNLFLMKDESMAYNLT